MFILLCDQSAQGLFHLLQLTGALVKVHGVAIGNTFDIYEVEVSILVDSPTSVNAYGSKIKKGESLMFEFLEEDFKLDGEATMEVSILKITT
ncbi:hypothetical protein KD050_01170 [Psychrobacillus sp. INOP01]|uniref:hypothetical protein n=1 Tax=Psychrobacillus sp. INOP01 TaxID=2829187 RepID=UPI001BAB2220|nr:hypothetical protein [Psychrobacillus sp. INOP01]QUG41941.1 hypothetical protein KD050_01170 [Psychrobacillus sp. INOP01]